MVRQRVAMLWVRQHVVTFQVDRNKITYGSVQGIRRSPPRQLSKPMRRCVAQESQGHPPRVLWNLLILLATTKKKSIFDLLRSENFSDPLLGCRRAQHRRI
ncbi:790_t:CDS:2 [Paraglomus brasilianum]|uniref:790_t:CDS:1 n=1 Tax=Paraglomus brasilianum TaxID=144538 RepID=A0A9N9GHB7_9GLOM|nr:790_t:CDS:2 [Paraglomus brasilianum]